ncbi:iron ABC transporter permease [Methanofollis aquaemaris]|uniref:Cobalamin import system permease protein BtuC n=1 Tax=Methanofollis aquaemaris TaxID=126734 RepID=A0A8A3S6B1_9EURY|nr:iron ABC transporter permease [Methanofollis aquaemaris]
MNKVNRTAPSVKSRDSIVAGTLCGLPIILFFVSLFLGRFSVDPLTVPQVLAAAALESIPNFPLSIPHTWPDVVDTVILKVRFPRVIAALLIGTGLAVSGASFQGLFRNPLVSPHILGVASGAGFGAALGIILSGETWVIQTFAFSFGVLAVGLTYTLAKIYKTTPTLVLVLAGIVVGSFFSALISLLKYMADPYEKLPAIVFWLMGSLSSVKAGDLMFLLVPIVLGTTVLLLIRWRINVLAMGEDEARTLGVDTARMARAIILCATLITATAVCFSGVIGWVGLVVPHIARMIVGPDYRKLLPLSAAIGASYLLIIDDLARTLTAAEIPLGILTAIIGAPVFAWLLKTKKVGWS